MLRTTIRLAFVSAMMALTLGGCAVTPHDPATTSWELDAGVEQVWQSAINTAEAMDLDVARIDSGTDTITTNWQTFHRRSGFADCRDALPDARMLMRHTIRVTPGDTGARLIVESSYEMQRNTGAGPVSDCPSTGEFERRFHARAIRLIARAE